MKKCPYCRATVTEKNIKRTLIVFHVRCPSCYACGPCKRSRLLASVAWDLRSTLTFDAADSKLQMIRSDKYPGDIFLKVKGTEREFVAKIYKHPHAKARARTLMKEELL